MLSDIEIASGAKMKPIGAIAAPLGIKEEELIPYGKYKAKISDAIFDRLKDNPDAKLVLVTAINPTPAGEGKTTVTVGIGEALGRMGVKSMIALREPSLGPVFGVKGGAAGGGYAQVVPMDEINLHFTGDLHAVTSANNLICAILDNHIHFGNELKIDVKRVIFKRVMDISDRALRSIIIGVGEKSNGTMRQDGFDISVASEIMAVLCLAADYEDLKARVGRIMVAWSEKGEPVYVRDLKAEGAVCALLKDAMLPNLVQTIENTPCLIHGGPFANIAHGCSSLRATKLAMKLCDYVVTEAGFGSDLGGEKFLDIKCRVGGFSPSAIVLVATVRALKFNGGVKKEELSAPNPEALGRGLCNLTKHIENLKSFGPPVVVAVNRFASDSDEELSIIKAECARLGVPSELFEGHAKGGEGAVDLSKKIIAACGESKNPLKFTYDLSAPIAEKIEKIAKNIYGAKEVVYSADAKKAIAEIQKLGCGDLPVCMTKTQLSLSDDPKKLGRPENFTLEVNGAKLSAGAGFVVAYCGKILTMPALPKVPSAENIDLIDGEIKGLF